MLDNIRQAETMLQGGFVALVGLVGVFLVLILFFGAIKVLQRIDRSENNKADKENNN